MCKDCWDASKTELLISNGDCDGILTPSISMSVLKKALFNKWKATKETSHVVHKAAIINPTSSEYTWTVTLKSRSKVQLSVRFI